MNILTQTMWVARCADVCVCVWVGIIPQQKHNTFIREYEIYLPSY